MNNAQFRIIINNEDRRTQRLIQKQIQDKYGSETVIGIAGSLAEAQQKILLERPNLVVLDTDLPSYSAFDLLLSIPKEKMDFQLIFICDAPAKAVEALKYSPAGFLLKPVISTELYRAVDKALLNIAKEAELANLKSLLKNLQKPVEEDPKITFPLLNRRTVLVRIKDIIRCESQGDVTIIHLSSNSKEKITASISISECELLLENHHFFRTHRQHIVNFDFVRDSGKFSQQRVKLVNEFEVPLARRRKQEFIKSFDTYKSPFI